MNSTSLNETPGQYTEPMEPKKPNFAYDFHFRKGTQLEAIKIINQELTNKC